MQSIFTYRTQERIGVIADLSHATQATSKGINTYVKELRKAAGISDPNALGMQDFMNDFGKGI